MTPSPEDYARAKALGFEPITQDRLDAEVDEAIRRRERATAKPKQAIRAGLSALERKLAEVERTLAEVNRGRTEMVVDRAIARGAIQRSARAQAVRLFEQDVNLARQFESALPASESLAELNRHSELWDEAQDARARKEIAEAFGICEDEVI